MRTAEEQMRSWIQAAEIHFLCKMIGLSLGGEVRSSVIQEELGVQLLLLGIERTQLKWFGHLMPPECLHLEVFQLCLTKRRLRDKLRTH